MIILNNGNNHCDILRFQTTYLKVITKAINKSMGLQLKKMIYLHLNFMRLYQKSNMQ